jgi:hypothetical protein
MLIDLAEDPIGGGSPTWRGNGGDGYPGNACSTPAVYKGTNARLPLDAGGQTFASPFQVLRSRTGGKRYDNQWEWTAVNAGGPWLVPLTLNHKPKIL